ncbi:MAG: hypothetical protein EOP00_04030 [Pedobacter sp.]|nr:MAG: hypothetical protein EOP00_04030 [Pedobacter sp.]
MKKIYLFIAIATLAITFGCEMNAHNQSIAVQITDGGYSFKAEYPKNKTNEVVTYIEENIKEEVFFSNAEGKKDENVTLTDRSKFHITSEPGFIKINFNKRDNTESSYQKMVKLCMGIKEIIK